MEKPLDGGQLIAIPLGGDLPGGRYRIRFQLEKDAEVYLSLARLTPGSFEQRNLVSESEVRDGVE